MKSLYFIRHGESEFNKSHKWTGSTDVPLTETGHRQAKQAGKKLKNDGLVIDVVISSPLERAHRTAKHIAEAINYPHEKILLNEQLIERDFGALEGKKQLVAATQYLVDESAIDKYENVESLAKLQARADNFLKYLHSLPHDTVLVVGHGAFGRALRRSILKEPIHKRGKKLANAEMVRFI